MEGVHRLTAQGKPVQVAPSMQEQYGIPVNTHTFSLRNIYLHQSNEAQPAELTKTLRDERPALKL